MFDRACNRLVIRLGVTTLAPLHVGAGDGGLDAAGPDARCSRTRVGGQQTAFVPGASLRGVLRAEAARRVRALGTLDGRRACDPDAPCGARLAGRPAADLHRAHCPVCRVFGSKALRGRVAVRDLLPAPLTDAAGAAEPAPVVRRRFPDRLGGWREVEVIPAGVRLHGEICIRDFQVWQLGLLATGLRALERGTTRLGALRALGFGHVAVSWPAAVFEQPLAAGEAPLDVAALVDERRARRHGLLPSAPLPEAAGTPHGFNRRFTLDGGALDAWCRAGTAALEALA